MSTRKPMTLVDRLIAPGATRGEVAAGFGTAAAGAVLALFLAVDAHLPALAVVVVVVIAFDLFGGAVVNATGSAKRWFHRPGRTAVHHLGFVTAHVHPFVLALTVPGFGWTTAAATYGAVLAGAVLVEFAPAGLRQPVAFAVTALALTAVLGLAPAPAAVAWFGPLLMIKLLLAHLLPADQSGAGLHLP
ncbi:hypothetical protein [Amycolatopsis sp. 195334CR]|uniref:hypothetical protein n=1 Tax=Amycolatopsis sp. 195334CR TaxID=2814588 RepID=UPI001A900E8A|nr:hypothetical protein [Amycolatopsis sp. 195334CR]MBN6042257.1 hypothetical protein [Amycolatopsis sp. 195334CR]